MSFRTYFEQAKPEDDLFYSFLDNGINFICKHADPIWFNHDGLSDPECTSEIFSYNCFPNLLCNKC